MGRCLAAADVVVMNTPEARDQVLKAFPGLSADRVEAIPNAFDPLDFPETPPGDPDGEAFRIVHTGSLHTEAGRRHREAGRLRRVLGGAVPGVDFLTRSHVFLLEAVDRLLREEPRLAGRIEVHLAGVFSQADRDVVAGRPYVRLREFLPHAETVPLMRSAGVLFLPMHDLPAGMRARLVPQKTYEYLAARRPILAAVPEGDARDLLAASGVAHVCRPGDVDAIAQALREELERVDAGRPAPVPDPAVLTRCGADRLAGEFAGLYERTAGRGGAVTPGPRRA
jgi:glycosyltransferase involved in cell wall biosynthesis